MNLREYEASALFQKHGIPVPGFVVVSRVRTPSHIQLPVLLKAQVLSGDRKKNGGIIEVTTKAALRKNLAAFFQKSILGERVKKVAVVTKLSTDKEFYASFSYDTQTRTPVLALSPHGGSGIAKAKTFPVDMTIGAPAFFIRASLKAAGFPSQDLQGLASIIGKLWSCFLAEHALLAEINPIIKDREGNYWAADAKVILDDEKVRPGERRFIDMEGDIAILASGGGASLLNIDTLLRSGGRPANYTEYSGNPPKEVVAELTRRVLNRKGLKGCWVIGGTANFTDIYETLTGFVEGLRSVRPKPTYPIVIRRDGPRQQEAMEMLRKVAAKEGYDFHLFGRETSMAETARIMTELIKHT